MKKILAISILIAALMIAGVGACGKATTTDGAYKLTHSAADVEYILGWDFIVSQCPDIGDYEKIEGFVHRGQTMQITPGETFFLDEDSPAAWASSRFVRTQWEGGRFRSFAVSIMFCETAEGLDEIVDEMVQMPGLLVQKEGDFVTGVHEAEIPIPMQTIQMQTIQFLLAGKHFVVEIGEFASSDESLFFDKNALTELLSIAQGKVSISEITPLPPEIPGRKPISERAAIEETIRGYVTTWNAQDFAQCLTYFTDYGDEDEALASLEFFRGLSGELGFQEIRDTAISGRTATVTVAFTIGGEEGTDQMQLRKVDGKWKIVW